MPNLPWHQIDTVLLDMDGTLLDLHFDSYFWLHHLPAAVAAQTNQSLADCKANLRQHYQRVAGTLNWYCLDYWATQLQVDIMALKQQLTHLIRLRPDTVPFLSALQQAGKQLILVTNAHPANLALKLKHTQLDVHIDTLISTHEFGVPKESQALWQQLQAAHPFDPRRTLFVDDNQAILQAAQEFGIAHLLAVANPDSQQPAVHIEQFAATTDYRQLVPAITAGTLDGGSQ